MRGMTPKDVLKEIAFKAFQPRVLPSIIGREVVGRPAHLVVDDDVVFG